MEQVSICSETAYRYILTGQWGLGADWGCTCEELRMRFVLQNKTAVCGEKFLQMMGERERE